MRIVAHPRPFRKPVLFKGAGVAFVCAQAAPAPDAETPQQEASVVEQETTPKPEALVEDHAPAPRAEAETVQGAGVGSANDAHPDSFLEEQVPAAPVMEAPAVSNPGGLRWAGTIQKWLCC